MYQGRYIWIVKAVTSRLERWGGREVEILVINLFSRVRDGEDFLISIEGYPSPPSLHVFIHQFV